MSEAFHQVFTIADKVVKFDDSLADEGELGQKVKRAMGRIKDRDPATTKLLKQTLDEVNKQARAMIADAAGGLISMAKDLKTLIEDYDRKQGELILNWKELESYSEEPLKDRMVTIYRTTYYFVQLLQMYVKKQPQSSGSAD
jgi:ferritin-like metal-binding protein YciE